MRVRNSSMERGFCVLKVLTAVFLSMSVLSELTYADQLVINCPGTAPFAKAGDTVRWNVTASGGNGNALRFFIQGPGSGKPLVDSISGLVTYVARWDDVFLWAPSCYDVGVTDGADSSYCSVCCMVGDGPGNRILIEPKNHVEIGSTIDVRIFMVTMLGSVGFGGFDFLISPGNPALAILSASPGTLYDSCGWEYFTYRFGEHDTCNSCPSGMIQITGLAETNPLTPHPTCGLQWQDIPFPLTLATLKIRVTYDPALYCEILPIRFFWSDCADNTVWSKPSVRKETAMAYRIYDFGNPESVWDPNAGVPGYFGAPLECAYDSIGSSRFHDMELKNGGIEILCVDPIGQRGDINVNGFPYEIADAVMYAEYFVNGLAAFGPHITASIAASDVNGDGHDLSLPDLIFLIRVILGDTPPLPKPVANQVAQVRASGGTISVSNSPMLGAALITLKGNTEVELLQPELRMLSHFDGENTRVLLTVPFEFLSSGFSGDLLSAHNSVIVSAELVDVDGRAVALDLELPTSFALEQNYPNPFNNATTISFVVPADADYKLSVINIAGQVVLTRAGHAEKSGAVHLSLDMSGLASGMYLYKLESGDKSATRKMLLLK